MENVAPSEAREEVLFFAQERPGETFYVFSMGLNGEDRKNLTPRELVALDPSASPDGEYIAYVSMVSPERYAFDLVVMKRDGSERRVLTHFPSGIAAVSPTWAPDGRQLAFTRLDPEGETVDVYVVDADGANCRRLCPGMFPAWSPDGAQILTAPYAEEGLFSVDPRTGTARKLLDDAVQEAAWSPDGRWIAVALSDSGDWDLLVMSADGSQRRGVVNLKDPASSLFAPRWTTDGRHILFTVVPESVFVPGGGEIHLINADGTNDRQLSADGAMDFTGGGFYYALFGVKPDQE